MRQAHLLLTLSLLVLTIAPIPRQASIAEAEEFWSTPVNLSDSPLYDNAPAVAATSQSAVTVAWVHSETADTRANDLLRADAPSPATPFRSQMLAASHPSARGGLRMRHDSLGRKHAVWWQYNEASVCDYYARIEADGRTSVVEQVPGSCGQNYKNTALGVGPDNNVHALFGSNLKDLFYWVRNDSGWTVTGEQMPGTKTPEAPAIGVTTGGTVIAAWKDAAAGGNGDIFAGTRQGAGNWRVENLSSTLTPGCEGNSKTDLPSLAADPSGGMRIMWTDEWCSPRNPDPTLRDPYYREWTPQSGWGALPPVRIADSPGNALGNAIVVDAAGTAHVVWVDQKNITTIRIFYSSGRGSSWASPVTPFAGWANGALTKDVALDYSPGYLHLAFGSTRDDPNKENYYSFLKVGAPPPAPPAPPPSGEQVPGGGSRSFPETGQTVTGVFLDYWNSHGALLQQGFPISGVIRETSELNGKSYLVQYFERAIFEYHPEYSPPNNVLLAQLGALQYKKKYPGGAPNQHVNQDAGAFFAETGHKVAGSFLQYWQAHGGLAQQGYPVSEEFLELSPTDGKTYTVQYFERAVFEWHPDNRPPYNVLLSLLGVAKLRERHGGR